jgi:pimeloyl-ACP methyl ester carboxylesterase
VPGPLRGLLAILERSRRGFAAQVKAMLARPDRTSFLPSIRSPTLVLCGAEDHWAPVAVHREQSQAIPGRRLTIVPDCGHMSPMEEPGAVGDAMAAWLQSAI